MFLLTMLGLTLLAIFTGFDVKNRLTIVDIFIWVMLGLVELCIECGVILLLKAVFS